MTYRKGVDLLALVLPALLQSHLNVRVIIGGDGPKLPMLKQVREQTTAGVPQDILA